MVPSSVLALRDLWFLPSHAVISAPLRELTVLREDVVVAVFVAKFSCILWSPGTHSGAL